MTRTADAWSGPGRGGILPRAEEPVARQLPTTSILTVARDTTANSFDRFAGSSEIERLAGGTIDARSQPAAVGIEALCALLELGR
jgi:hypothetical protein